jgi:hypothetical protein
LNLLIKDSVREEINNLIDLSDELKLPTPYLVGGTVRDMYLEKNLSDDYDISVNSGSKSFFLGCMFAAEHEKPFLIRGKENISVLLEDGKLDFSTGFISKHVDQDLSLIEKETLSRDFTINALLLNLKTKKVLDYTGYGFNDCNKKILRTCMDPIKTFADDPKRIFRGMLYASKYDLKFDKKIIKFLKEEKEFVKNTIKEHRVFIENNIAKSLMFDEKKTLSFLLKADCISDITLAGSYKNILIKYKLIDYYLDKQDQTNDLADGSDYQKYHLGGPSSVPDEIGEISTKDDNNVREYNWENFATKYDSPSVPPSGDNQFTDPNNNNLFGPNLHL